MRQRDFFTEYTLMSLAAIGAFYIGEYPEGVAVMLFYTRIGEALQERAVERARRNIRAPRRYPARTGERFGGRETGGDARCAGRAGPDDRGAFFFFFGIFFFLPNNLLPFCPCISVTNKSDY